MLTFNEKEFLLLFAGHLKALRKAHGLTQEQLAFECGITASQIVRIENGKLNTGIYTLYKIAIVLDIPIQKLLEI